jgi:pullulanase
MVKYNQTMIGIYIKLRRKTYMKVFVDGFNLLRIESNQYIDRILLKDNEVKWLKNEGYNQFFTTLKPIRLHLDDTIEINGDLYPIFIGIVTLTKEFEEKFRYDGNLGYEYHKTHTVFRLFSPVLKEAFVVVDQKKYEMKYIEPIWEATILEDLDLKPYHFEVRLVDTFKIVKDPYTNACSTKESYVIDWQKTSLILPSPIQLKSYTDAVIYEGHIRDLTIHLDVLSKGLFKGVREFSKTLKGSVLQYIKRLGATHLQLLPIFDFDGVDDINKDQFYNWGYNPSQYFAVDGWYSKHPDDPYHRINHLKKVINEAHRLKLGVNMDVVYNHVYKYKDFPYDDLVPGYFYRHDSNKKMTDVSFCGNDVETRNYMVRKLIIDSLIHFVKHFQIDGFRFDLMGLMDIATMHEIESKLKAINPNIMLYGEGWNMITEVPSRQRANMNNQALFPSYAHFNDFYRNTMKGDLYGNHLGYTMGNKHLTQKAMDAIIGSKHLFQTPNQSINYVECHDNLTYYDQMKKTKGLVDSNFTMHQDFANHLIAISQGIPFYHAGQEFYRSKKGVENSYNSPDEINHIDWNFKKSAVANLQKILKIRKKYSIYRTPSPHDQISISKENHMIIYQLETQKEILKHYIKNYQSLEKISLEKGKLIFSSQDVLFSNGSMIVDHPGVYIVVIKK